MRLNRKGWISQAYFLSLVKSRVLQDAHPKLVCFATCFPWSLESHFLQLTCAQNALLRLLYDLPRVVIVTNFTILCDVSAEIQHVWAKHRVVNCPGAGAEDQKGYMKKSQARHQSCQAAKASLLCKCPTLLRPVLLTAILCWSIGPNIASFIWYCFAVHLCVCVCDFCPELRKDR